MLTQDGEIWVDGYDDNDQIGQGKKSEISKRKKLNTANLGFYTDEKVAKIQAHLDYSVIITNYGNVFLTEKMSEKQTFRAFNHSEQLRNYQNEFYLFKEKITGKAITKKDQTTKEPTTKDPESKDKATCILQ